MSGKSGKIATIAFHRGSIISCSRKPHIRAFEVVGAFQVI
jgi:hypothetical protein